MVDTINTIKFSQFTSGGDLSNDKFTVGLDSTQTVNTIFNNPWTFLASGTTGDRPTPVPAIYFRLRFNTTLQVYEYYDPNTASWIELSGSGMGTVNPGLANDLAFYGATGTAISPIAHAANSVLVTNGSDIPSLSTTLPTGLSIPGAIITSSTAALTSGSVVAAPVAGTDIANKAYVDAQVSGDVTSITGTTNQVIASAPTGAVTLSLPQDIALGSTPTFGGLTLSSIPLGGSSGGTGVNNGTKTITLGGNLTTSGAFSSTFTMTNTTAVTFPTSGTLATTSQIPTGAALTKTDDTNVTLTLGGSPTTALVNAASLTLGWTGTLAVGRGGTGVSSVTTSPTASSFAGWDANSNLSANAFIGGFATTVTAAATTTLTVASKQVQEFTGSTTQTVVMPVASTLVAGQSYTIINNSSGNVTVNSSGGNTILTMAANTKAEIICVLNSGTTAASWNASYIFDAGAGVLSITGTANQVIASAATGNVTLSLPQSIATASSPTFAGLTLSSPLTVPNGGTGLASTTAYAVLCGGTTSTDALQSVASVGTSGQLLVSAGAGALPAFQTVITDWVAYTPTLTGFGTPSSVQVYSRRVGDTLEIRGRFTSGTSTAVEARMTLGYAGSNANVTSSNTKISSIQYAGYATLSSVTTTQNNTLIEANTGYITFGIQNASQAGLTKANGNSVLGAGVSYSFIASIPIDSWP